MLSHFTPQFSGQVRETLLRPAPLAFEQCEHPVIASPRSRGRDPILDGRDLETRRALGQSVCDVITEAVRTGSDGPTVQVSVEVLEMERASYAKKVIGG